jgi:hypothetical protein
MSRKRPKFLCRSSSKPPGAFQADVSAFSVANGDCGKKTFAEQVPGPRARPDSGSGLLAARALH